MTCHIVILYFYAMEKKVIKGFIYGTISAIAYGTNPLFALPMYKDGHSASSVLVYRYAIGATLLAVLMLARKIPFALKKNEILPMLIGAQLMGICSLTLFKSYEYMDAGVASTILFTYPVVVAVIMATFFHEKLHVKTILSILLAIVGVAVLSIGNSSSVSMTGLILVILSSISYSTFIVAIKVTNIRNINVMAMTFYSLVFALPIFLVSSFLSMGGVPGLHSPIAWVCAVLIAIVPTIISLVLLSASIKNVGPTAASIIGALEPTTAVVIGVFVFNEAFTMRLLAGILLIVISVVLVIIGGNDPENSQLQK